MPTNIIQPSGADAALEKLRLKLASALPFVTAYGEAELLYKGSGRARERVWALYTGTDSQAGYTELMPSHSLGGFCFFTLATAQASGVATGLLNAMAKMTAQASLVIFWDYRVAFPDDHHQRTVRHVERLAAAALTAPIERTLVVTLKGTATEFGEVFRPARLTETDQLVMRRPYGCLRVDFTLEFNPFSLTQNPC